MSQASVKILLVEDNPGDARLFQEFIKEFSLLSVSLNSVSTLKEALEFVTVKDLEVILLDLTLPDSTGIETLQKIKENFPDVALIVLTGLNDTEMAKKAVRFGAQDYMIKGKIDSFLLEKSILYSIERNQYYKQSLEIEATKRENKKLTKINNRLNQLIIQVEKSKSRLEEFAYVATHNLRAPVVNLKSLVDFFGTKKGELDAKSKTIFQKIEITTNNLVSTLQDLINIIAITKKNIESKQKIDLQDLINSVSQSLESQVREANAEIITDFSEVKDIIYPKGHLESICQNLITNSIKYKSDKPPIIKIKSEKKNEFICLCFEDNGVGIDMKIHKDKIFKMFQRLNAKGEGKGLGLYIVKSQVERLGGKIEVESELGKGSTFCIYLKNDPEMNKEENESTSSNE